MKRILAVFGTRPEVIKLATVVHALRARPRDCRLTLCSTGQHREMLRQTLSAFELQPDIELDLMTAGQTPGDLVGRLLLAIRPVLDDHRPDVVIVQGDTATVLAAALAGFFAGAKVAHVEAGLRTGDKHAPFPEEINRRVAGAVADFHFAPTPRARENLLRENITSGSIFVTGNTVVDALHWMREHVRDRPLPAELDPAGRRLVLITAHRRESFGEPFRQLCQALRDIAERHEDVLLLYPVHLNPNVQQPVREILNGCPRVRLVEPLDYAAFVNVLTRAHLVLTDSGGIQEEAPALHIPVLVMREKTERPEAIAAGVVRLVGTRRETIVGEASRLLTDSAAHAAMTRGASPYGDGLAARRIAEVLLDGRLTTPEFGAA